MLLNQRSLKAIINSYKDYIDETNYLDVEDIIATVKEELLEAEKDYAKDILSNYEADASEKVLAVINKYKDLIDEEDDIALIKQILNEAIAKIEQQKLIDEAFNNLEAKYEEFITTDRHYYDEAGLAEIERIYNDAKEAYDNDLITLEELNKAILDLDKVTVRYTNNKVRVDDSIRPNEGEALGYARSEKGFVKGTELVVKVVDLTKEDIERLKNLLKIKRF